MCWMAHWWSGSRVGPRSRSRRGTRFSSRPGGHTKPPMKERPLPRSSPPIWWRRVSPSPRPSRTEVSTHAIGTVLGACVLLGRIAIGDWLTALVALVSLVVLFRWKVSNPLLVAAAAIIGLIAFPLLKPEWIFVK